MRLTPTTFFNRYIVQPCSRDLNRKEKFLATLLSIILAPFTLGILHRRGQLQARKLEHFTFKQAEKSQLNYQKVAAKTHQTALQALNPHKRNAFPISRDSLSKIIQQKIFNPSRTEKRAADKDCRAALFSNCFAYLYAKYHPEYTDIGKEELIIAQLAAVGYTAKELSELGVSEQKAQKVFDSFAGKWLTNADSASKAGLFANAPSQSPKDFDRTRSQLDVYNELHELANGNPGHVLKDGLTYGDFLEELDFLRREMDMLTFQTSRRSVRQDMTKQDGAYYDLMKSLVNPIEYPLLTHALQSTGTIQPPEIPSKEDRQKVRALASYRQTLRESLDYVTSSRLETLRDELYPLAGDEECAAAYALLTKELNERKAVWEEYLTGNIVETYPKLRPVERDKIPDPEIELITTSHPLIQLRQRHIALKSLLGKEVTDSLEHANTLYESSLQFLEEYQKVQGAGKDLRTLTTACLALQNASRLYLECGMSTMAAQALKAAAEKVPFDENLLGFKLEGVPDDSPVFHSRSCGDLRFRRLRACKKTLDGVKQLVASFELTSKARSEMADVLDVLAKDPNVRMTKVKSEYASKDFSTGEYYTVKDGKKVSKSIKLLFWGGDKKITFKDSPVEIVIGESRMMHNAYHTVRMRAPEGTPVAEFHKALARIGFPTATMPSRPEDIASEGLNRALTLRHPKEVYGHQKQHGLKDPLKVLTGLPDQKQAVIRGEVSSMTVSQTGVDKAELVNPKASDEAWKAGLRGFGFFVQGGGIEGTSKLMVNILKTGLLSTQERYERGILGLGNVPSLNFWQGSANQVFTRPLTKKLFSEGASLGDFSLTGPVTILIDAKAMERMPYTYLSDHAGLRNPKLFTPLWLPFPQPPKVWFKGMDQLIKRPAFPDNIEQIEEKGNHLAETMFDRDLGPQYFKKLLVQKSEDKYILMKTLRESGIHDINGLPLEQAIVVTQKLSPDLVEDFESETLPG